MTGANYMGGKRNVAKARTKDSTRRIQRGFFGRQRLNMFAQGIPHRTLNNLSSTEQQRLNIPTIEFAHAPTASGSSTKNSVTTSRKSGESITSSKNTGTTTRLPETPQSKTLRLRESSSTGRSSSRVLDVLDTREPLFLRATLNRILNLPDLAGISERASTKRLFGKEFEDDAENDENNHKKKKTTHATLLSPLKYHAKRPPPPTIIDISPFNSRQDYLDGPFEDLDSGERNSMHDGLEAQGPSDLNRPSQQAFSLPDTVESRTNDTRVFFSLPPSSEQAFSSEFIAAGDFEYQGFDDSSFDHLEDVSPLGEYEDQDQIDKDDDARPNENHTNEGEQPFRFVQDNLYEHHDPWHTIGVILGLSPVRSDDCILDKSFEEHEMSPNCRLEIEDPAEMEEVLSISGDPGNGGPREKYHFWRQRNDDDMTEDWQSSPKSTAKDLHMAFEDESMQKLRYDPGWKDSAALFDPTSFSNSSPTKSAQATAVTEDPQSPFRILLESRRHANSSSTHNHSSDPILALSQSSSSHPQSSIGPRTPPPCNIDIENTQSPFRALLATRNMNHKKSSLDFTGHSLSGSDVAPPPRRSTPESMAFDYAGSRLLKEVDGIFEGPCLFPDDDASDED